MNTSSTLKKYNSGKYIYLYIYYKLKGTLIKINTKMKYLDGMHKKDLFYNSKMPDYKDLNREMHTLKAKVDEYISYQLRQWNPSVNQKECKNYIETGEILYSDEIFSKPKTKTFFDFYNEFYGYKDIQLQNKPSLKDYKSLENALYDYENYQKINLTFEVINDEDFFNRFRNFLYDYRQGNYKTEGGLNANTVKKRISSLKTFMRYVQKKKYFKFDASLFDYRVKGYYPDFVTLSRDEITLLENLDIKKKNWQKIIDVFICNCFMSLRYSDLATFEKGEFLKTDDNQWYYYKLNEKTGKEIEVFILPTALNYLEKYNFKLPVYTNQYFNRELKNIFEYYDLFGQKMKKKEMRKGKPVTHIFLRRDLISTHTCRRTYITLCIDKGVPFNAIQASTGHTQLSTLSRYVKRKMNPEKLAAIDKQKG